MIKLGNLETNIARHCNLACTSCNHGSAIADRWFMNPEITGFDLRTLSHVAHFGFHCIQGGEPTLHPEIENFMDQAVGSGIADHYGILTNGTLLHKLPYTFWQKAKDYDYEIRVSRYPALTQAGIDIFTEKAKDFGVNLRMSNEFDSFYNMFTTHDDGGKDVWSRCRWRQCWTIHQGYFYNCPIAAFTPGQFPEKFDTPPHPYVDGVHVDDLTEEKIKWMMTHEHPLKSCEICTGGIKNSIPWSQERDREKWIEKSTV